MTPQEAIAKIREILSEVEYKNIPLMEKPTDEDFNKNVYTSGLKLDRLSTDVRYGSQMHTHYSGADETVWHFPDGIEEKIDDNKRYKIWYTWRDAADPADLSTYYRVYYIEEVLSSKEYLRSEINKLFK